MIKIPALSDCSPGFRGKLVVIITLPMVILNVVCMIAFTDSVAMNWMLLNVLATSGAGLLIAIFLQRFISAPVIQLTKTAQAIVGDQDYSIRATRSSNNELGTLVDVFNELLVQIEENQKAFEKSNQELAKRNSERKKRVFVTKHQLEHEILKHKQTQHEREERTAVLNSVMQSVSEGIVVADLEGELLYVNRAAEAILDSEIPASDSWSWPEHLSMRRASRTPVEFGSDPLSLAVQGNSCAGQEFLVTRQHSSETTIIEVGATPLMDDSGNRIGGVAIFRDISAQKLAEQEQTRLGQELIEASRKAGMAEVATGVLHNVGNILNSVNISTSTIRRRFDKSAFSSLQKLSQLIAEHEHSFADFVLQDDRGKKLPTYVQKLTEALAEERSKIGVEIDDLGKNVEHIRQVVSMQQSMAKCSGVIEELSPTQLIENALIATRNTLTNHAITIKRDFDTIAETIISDKHKILQVLINLITNAKDALVEYGPDDPTITVGSFKRGKMIVFRVSDNGIGISTEELNKIFQHGFTTKKSGHGFGLHSCANMATELGGTVTVVSHGSGCGATFELALPVAIKPEKRSLILAP